MDTNLASAAQEYLDKRAQMGPRKAAAHVIQTYGVSALALSEYLRDHGMLPAERGRHHGRLGGPLPGPAGHPQHLPADRQSMMDTVAASLAVGALYMVLLVVLGASAGVFAAVLAGWLTGAVAAHAFFWVKREVLDVTVPASQVDAIRAQRDIEWLNRPTPPIPFAPSWEDDSLFADAPQNPRIAEAIKMRDEALAAERYDEAIDITERIIRLLDEQASPKMVTRPGWRQPIVEYGRTSPAWLPPDSDQAAIEGLEVRKRQRAKQAAIEGLEVRKRQRAKQVAKRFGPNDWQSTDDGYVRLWDSDMHIGH